MESYVDAHKLIFHPVAVAGWLAGKPTYPINMEICPSGGVQS